MADIKIPFYGTWSMRVVAKNADFLQRVVIEESLASDGPVDGVVGNFVPVIDGEKWMIFVESSGNNGASWQASQIIRVPRVVAPNGLIVNIYSDDWVPGGSDGDYDDLILQFGYLNPDANPPYVEPYPFTLPPDSFRPKLPPRKPPCGCEKPRKRCC